MPAYATDVALRPFAAADLPEYTAWFADPETAARLSAPDDAWLRHIAGQDASAWSADAGGRLVAVVQADADADDPGRAHVCVLTDPTRRRRGWGTRVLRRFLAGPGHRFAAIEGRIEPDNRASIAMTLTAGFRQLSDAPDEDGMLRFEYRTESRTARG